LHLLTFQIIDNKKALILDFN